MKHAPNLILVGPMGAGKTSLGPCLAVHLGLRFVDVDQELERRSGSTIAQLFAHQGEAGFRLREQQLLASLCQGHGQLIATGGGAVLHPETRRLLPRRGFVLHLDAGLEIRLQRLARDHQRPLLPPRGRRERLQRLDAERAPLYAEVADLRFDTGHGSTAQNCTRLIELLHAHWHPTELPTELPAPTPCTAATPSSPGPQRIEIDVALGPRRYPIHIGPGLLAQDDWPQRISGRHVLILSDQHVAPHYLDTVRQRLPDKTLDCLILPPGEQEKNLSRFNQAVSALAAMGASRDACVIALGGGVIGDLSGFVAACWMRGIACLQLPTTLLAMVDAAVGGKTALNLPEGKNLIGAFHQPLAVIADTTTLATLPARELRAGLAEVVKYGALGDAEFFAWLEQQAPALRTRQSEALTAAVAHSCRHKAAIVMRDETEQGERALLNFGHSFAHALEAAAAYDDLLHGEAVAIGMLLAARLSRHLGLASDHDRLRLAALLRALDLPLTLPRGSDPERLLHLMRLDKKNRSGQLRLILWQGPGRALIVPDVDEAAVRNCLQQALQTPD